MITVYLDVCALCRLFDDRAQHRVRLEAEVIDILLERVESGLLNG